MRDEEDLIFTSHQTNRISYLSKECGKGFTFWQVPPWRLFVFSPQAYFSSSYFRFPLFVHLRAHNQNQFLCLHAIRRCCRQSLVAPHAHCIGVCMCTEASNVIEAYPQLINDNAMANHRITQNSYACSGPIINPYVASKKPPFPNCNIILNPNPFLHYTSNAIGMHMCSPAVMMPKQQLL